MKKLFRAASIPAIEIHDAEKGTFYYYAGKAMSNEGDAIYWIGGSLCDSKINVYLSSFDQVMTVLKVNADLHLGKLLLTDESQLAL